MNLHRAARLRCEIVDLAAFLPRSVLYLATEEAITYEARKQCCFLIHGQSHFAGSGLGFMAEEFMVERAVKKLERDEPEKYSSLFKGRGYAEGRHAEKVLLPASASEILPCRGLPESSAAQRVSRGDLPGLRKPAVIRPVSLFRVPCMMVISAGMDKIL